MVTSIRPPGLGGTLLDLLLPPSCAGCGARGSPCCARCAAMFHEVHPVARGPTGTVPVYALARYRDVPRRLVLAFKERGRRDLARPLGAALAGALPYLAGARPDAEGTWWLVPAPSRPSAARARGGSHLLALARQCASALAAAGSPAAVAPALRLAGGARDAVGLDHAGRAANLAGKLRLRAEGSPPRGSPVVLLDDVVTTGATASACVAVLSGAGVEVTAVLTLTAAG